MRSNMISQNYTASSFETHQRDNFHVYVELEILSSFLPLMPTTPTL